MVRAKPSSIAPATQEFLTKSIKDALLHLEFLSANHDVLRTITNLQISLNILGKMNA